MLQRQVIHEGLEGIEKAGNALNFVNDNQAGMRHGLDLPSKQARVLGMSQKLAFIGEVEIPVWLQRLQKCRFSDLSRPQQEDVSLGFQEVLL